MVVKKDASAAIRTGPCVKDNKIIDIEAGTEVTGIGNAVTGAEATGLVTSNQWQLVNYNNTIGFIHSSMLEETTQPPPPPPPANEKLIFPFNLKDDDGNDQAWQICQGYKGSVSHYAEGSGGVYSFDIAAGIENIGPNACYGDAAGTAGKKVIALGSGTITYSAEEIIHLTLDSPVSNGYGSVVKCIVIGHLSDTDRLSKDTTVNKGDTVGIVKGYLSTDKNSYSHIHIAAYSEKCTSEYNIPFGTAFDGYNFSAQCDKNEEIIEKQYQGCTINPPTTYTENKCEAESDSNVCAE